MFNKNRFREEVTGAVDRGTLRNIPVKSKRDAFDVIARELNVSPETVKKWFDPGKHGTSPRMGPDIENLEIVMGLSPGSLVTGTAADESDTQKGIVSDFTKEKICEAYELLRNYVRSRYLPLAESEEETLYNLETTRVMLPTGLYEKFADLLNEILFPMFRERRRGKEAKKGKEEGARILNDFAEKELSSYFMEVRHERA